jgi:hypothetical protein
MRAFPIFAAAFAIVVPAGAAVQVPSFANATPEQWTAFTRRSVEAGDFAAWRDALADQIRFDLPPGAVAKADAPGAAQALAQWRLLRDALAGEPDALSKVAAGENGKEFLVWLLTNREVLEDYHGIASVFKMKPKRTNGLEGWREIWNSCSESRDKGLWRRVATACAIAFAEPRGTVTARERFDFYRSSHAAGQLVPYFDKALPFELALTVHADGRGNDDLEWAQDVTPKEKKTQSGVGNYGHSLMAYRLDNYRGLTVQGPEYYDRKRNDLSTAMEYGGVCGMISHMNMTVANAHGAPAFTVGQPGHCAYVWKSDDKTWSGGNFISGWTETHDSHQQPFWLSSYSANINLVSAAVESAGFAKAERLRALGAVWKEKDAQKAQEILAAASAADPLDYSVWSDRIEAALAWEKAPALTWRTMAAELTKAYPKFPMAMNDLLGKFEAQKLLATYSDTDKVAYAAAAARAMTSVPAAEQWDLIYPAWKPWLARQLGAMGVPEKSAAAVVEANLVVKAKKKDDKAKPVDAESVWAQLAVPKRPQVEALFAALLPAVEQNGTLYKGAAAAWLAMVAEDAAANGRAAKYFQTKLAAATDLREIEMLAEAVLNATHSSADARAELVTLIRKRAAATKKPDPARMDSLLGLMAKHDFRDASRIGAWTPVQLAKGGEQTLEWDLTPMLAKAAGEYSLSLNFRWTAGDPLALKAVRLFENETELSADSQPETADATLKPAVFTVHLPKPKAGAKYMVKATATGGADSAGVVLSRAEPAATFNKEEWAGIGGWGGKEIKAAPEITDGWHEMEFDASKLLREAGPAFVLFKYNSYSSPRVMNVRLFVDGREVAGDLHSCNPISGANTMYALRMPSAPRSDSKVTVRALFTHADGWGTVYVRKQGEDKSKTAAR